MTQKRALPIDSRTLWLLPVTTVLVSCVGKTARPNIVTIAACGIASSDPPLISLAIGTRQYSLELIRETKDFVVNVPPYDLVKATDWCGGISGRKVDKFAGAGLTPGESLKVSSPYIVECPVNYECTLWNIVSCGSHDLVLGEIQLVHIDESALTEAGDDLDPARFNPLVSIGRQYWNLGEKVGYWHQTGRDP